MEFYSFGCFELLQDGLVPFCRLSAFALLAFNAPAFADFGVRGFLAFCTAGFLAVDFLEFCTAVFIFRFGGRPASSSGLGSLRLRFALAAG
jgi:hypothetical protein